MTAETEFDHHGAEANADPVAYYARIRRGRPVGRTSAHGGFYYTTRYADVARIARDDETFSSARSGQGGQGVAIVIPKGAGLEQYPIELDPPRSTEYRELMNPLLTPAAVAELAPLITRHVTRVIDQFIDLGSCDLVRDFTNPVPTAVTLDWLGFPDEDWTRLAGPVHDIFAAPDGSERARRGAEGLAYMDARITELVKERREEPRDDAVSALVARRKPDGSEFTADELVSVIGSLIAGGVDTTTSLTGSTLIYLAKHPAQRQRLIETPDLLDTATEEFLRVFSPSQSMARTITTDTRISGCPVTAGDRVLISWVAANHDPAVFPEPEEIRLDRDASRHLSFGIGTHRCVGAHLARAMFRAMITQVLTRLPDYRITAEGLVPYPTRGNQTGWDSIPAVFTPGTHATGAVDSAAATGTAARAGTLALTVSGTIQAADDVVAIRLARAGGGDLPPWQPGAHLELRLPSGRVRQYSLCGDPSDRLSWRIAVLREHAGRGGSAEVHDIAVPGTAFTVRGPRNHFRLVEAPEYLFLAGGIGVTPIIAMIRGAAASGVPFRAVYGGRSRSSMAFAGELRELAGSRLTLLPQDEAGLPDLPGLMSSAPPGTAVYCCGPAAMITAAEAACDRLGVRSALHVERFTAGDGLEAALGSQANTAFTARLARSGLTVEVPAEKRLIDAIRDVTPGLSYDCEKGYCGACETRVLAGTPEHRDSVLTEEERAAGRSMMICVGRCSSGPLVLDL
jgi:cytochrome P450/ferredoxin-NADP reductase